MAMCQLLSDLFLYQIFLYFSKFKRTGDHFITKDESTSENPDEIDKKWQAITNLVKHTNAYFLHRESRDS